MGVWTLCTHPVTSARPGCAFILVLCNSGKDEALVMWGTGTITYGSTKARRISHDLTAMSIKHDGQCSSLFRYCADNSRQFTQQQGLSKDDALLVISIHLSWFAAATHKDELPALVLVLHHSHQHNKESNYCIQVSYCFSRHCFTVSSNTT